jgi:hypothetical protein
MLLSRRHHGVSRAECCHDADRDRFLAKVEICLVAKLDAALLEAPDNQHPVQQLRALRCGGRPGRGQR